MPPPEHRGEDARRDEDTRRSESEESRHGPTCRLREALEDERQRGRRRTERSASRERFRDVSPSYADTNMEALRPQRSQEMRRVRSNGRRRWIWLHEPLSNLEVPHDLEVLLKRPSLEPSSGASEQGMAQLKPCDECAWLVSPSWQAKLIPALSQASGTCPPTKATEGTGALTAATEGTGALTAAKAATDGKRKSSVTGGKAKRKVCGKKPEQKARQRQNQTPPQVTRFQRHQSTSSSGQVQDTSRSHRAQGDCATKVPGKEKNQPGPGTSKGRQCSGQVSASRHGSQVKGGDPRQRRKIRLVGKGRRACGRGRGSRKSQSPTKKRKTLAPETEGWRSWRNKPFLQGPPKRFPSPPKRFPSQPQLSRRLSLRRRLFCSQQVRKSLQGRVLPPSLWSRHLWSKHRLTRRCSRLDRQAAAPPPGLSGPSPRCTKRRQPSCGRCRTIDRWVADGSDGWSTEILATANKRGFGYAVSASPGPRRF